MKIAGSHRLPGGREHVYRLLQDPQVLARCMPGCESLERTGEDEYRMKMKLLLGSVSGLFDGQVRIADQRFPEQFRLTVEGNGKIGFMKGGGLLTLSEDAGATDVAYDGDVEVGGTIASVGQRLLDATARMIIRKFFSRAAEAAAAQTVV